MSRLSVFVGVVAIAGAGVLFWPYPAELRYGMMFYAGLLFIGLTYPTFPRWYIGLAAAMLLIGTAYDTWRLQAIDVLKMWTASYLAFYIVDRACAVRARRGSAPRSVSCPAPRGTRALLACSAGLGGAAGAAIALVWLGWSGAIWWAAPAVAAAAATLLHVLLSARERAH